MRRLACATSRALWLHHIAHAAPQDEQAQQRQLKLDGHTLSGSSTAGGTGIAVVAMSSRCRHAQPSGHHDDQPPSQAATVPSQVKLPTNAHATVTCSSGPGQLDSELGRIDNKQCIASSCRHGDGAGARCGSERRRWKWGGGGGGMRITMELDGQGLSQGRNLSSR